MRHVDLRLERRAGRPDLREARGDLGRARQRRVRVANHRAEDDLEVHEAALILESARRFQSAEELLAAVRRFRPSP